MNEQEALIKLQQEELDILLVVKDICEKNNIRWFCDSGTALGAIRHQGFIPWDDDIDIGMQRQDYDKFLQLAEEGKVPEGYSIRTSLNTDGYTSMFAKVYKDGTIFATKETIEAGCKQAIYIDVFPYDRIGRTDSDLKKQIKIAKKWQSLSYLYYLKNIQVPHDGVIGFIEKSICRFGHIICKRVLTPELIAERFNRAVDISKKSEKNQWICLPWPNQGILTEKDLFPCHESSFEGHKIPVPLNYNKYLTLLYGEWKKLPPKEERRTHLPVELHFSDGTSWHKKSPQNNAKVGAHQ